MAINAWMVFDSQVAQPLHLNVSAWMSYTLIGPHVKMYVLPLLKCVLHGLIATCELLSICVNFDMDVVRTSYNFSILYL